MVPWLDALVHNSFVYLSRPGMTNCWHMMVITPRDLVDWKAVPQGLLDMLNEDTQPLWILLKHGSKNWPIRITNDYFEHGWSDFCNDHELRTDNRIILAAERKWIFDVIILSAHDQEVLFPWTRPQNVYWQTPLIPQADQVNTSCIPSIIINQIPIVRFGYFHKPLTQDIEEFHKRLRPATETINLNHMPITMGAQRWLIPYFHDTFDDDLFKTFIQALDLEWWDYVFVTLLPNRELKVVVIDTSKKHERLYDWI